MDDVSDATDRLVVTFSDVACCASSLVGGKASQLALLTQVQKQVRFLLSHTSLFFIIYIYIFFFFLFCLVYFSFQPVLHDWCNKGCGMCYPVCGMVHIKEPLLLIGKSSPCGGSGFPLSLSEWSFTICLTAYNRKIKCVECIVK